MTCQCGRSYVVRQGDILFDIAQRELGDGNRWRDIMNPDCSKPVDETIFPGQELCIPNGSEPPEPPGNGGFADIVSRQIYESMFPNRNGLYSYDSLVRATQRYPNFCNEEPDTQRKREAAAFLANIAHETGSLQYIEELRCIPNGCGDEYCDRNNTQYPCQPGRSYHGRGPMQLSWNYNYGAAGQALGQALLTNPDLVKSDGVISFSTALWFWMTPQPPKPSCHDVMSGLWTPSPEDISKGRLPGFGMTINIINGGLECSIPTPPQVDSRVGFYQRFTQMLGVSTGDNVYCDQMAHY
ncbi:glycoside hydrolase family 19 protein [Pleurocapsa sp. PCC 7319]|uniref:glycoside hydrolase family 19 protein n=1 Tax=Pleurocapsa sp. PCC 7319 TaxID=118161 RepID=UPI000344D028|nr:glycoside hydrolase family 19 protein [Pleurocapsa sp. PCC 7319]